MGRRFNANGTTAYYCTDPSKYADDTATGYTNIGTLPSSGYIKDLIVTDNGLLIPKTTGGSETTYIPDYRWSSSGWRVLDVGGYWASGTDAGLCASMLAMILRVLARTFPRVSCARSERSDLNEGTWRQQAGENHGEQYAEQARQGMGAYLPDARQDEHGWVYDEYVTEVADGADLQKRVAAQADALLLQAVGEEYGAPLTQLMICVSSVSQTARQTSLRGCPKIR